MHSASDDSGQVELELETPTEHKLWRARRSGALIKTESGNSGKKLRSAEKDHESEEKAKAAFAKAVRKKYQEGYFPAGSVELPPSVELDESSVEVCDEVRELRVPNEPARGKRRPRWEEPDDEDAGRVPSLRHVSPPQLLQYGTKYGYVFFDGPSGTNLYFEGRLRLGKRHFIRDVEPELSGKAFADFPWLDYPWRSDGKAMLVAHHATVYELDIETARASEVTSFESEAALRQRRVWLYDHEGKHVLHGDGANLVSMTLSGENKHPIADLGSEKIVAAQRLWDGSIAVLQPSKLTLVRRQGARWRVEHGMHCRFGEVLGTHLGGRVLVYMGRHHGERATVMLAVHLDGLHEMRASKLALMDSFDARGSSWMIEAAPGGRVPWRAFKLCNLERAWSAAQKTKPLADDYAIEQVPLHDAIVTAVGERRGPAFVRAAFEQGAKLELRAYGGGATALGFAVAKGDVEIVKLVLELGADQNAISLAGRSPLAQAFESGRPDIADLLMASGATPSVPTTLVIEGKEVKTEAPLVAAARQGYQDHVELLLQLGAGVDALGHDGATALTAAAGARHEELALFLLDHGANVDAVVPAGPSPLEAAARGRASRVLVELIKRGASDARGPVGASALKGALLSLSVNEPVTELVDALLAAGARDTSAEALHRAVDAGHTGAVKAFLEAGANPNEGYFTANAPAPPLHFALFRKQPVEPIVTALLAAGAAFDVLDDRGFTPIRYSAANHTDLRYVRRMLELGAKLDRGAGQWNALHQATHAGNLEMMRVLLDAGSDIDEKTVHGLVAAEIAVYNDRPEALRLLLQMGANVDGGDFTPLMSAAVKNRVAMVELLLEHGADPKRRAVNPYGTNKAALTAQEHAEAAGAVEAAALIAARSGAGFATLHGAARADDLGALEKLLAEGADPNALEGAEELTPLHVAKSAAAIELLVRHGADVDCEAKTNHTPLVSQALSPAAGETVPALLRHGADAKREAGTLSALHAAAIAGDLEVARLLLDAGAPVEPTRARQRTPLHEAVAHGHAELVELLCSKGADPNALDEGNIAGRRGPLHVAAIGNHVECARVLLRFGAAVDLSDEREDDREWGCNTPLHWAAHEGSFEVLCELLRHDSSALHVQNARGRYPLDFSDDHRCVEVMQAVFRGATVDAHLVATSRVRDAAHAADQAGRLWIEHTTEKIPDLTGAAPAKLRDSLGKRDWVRSTRRDKSLVLRFDKGPYRVALGDAGGIHELDTVIRAQTIPYDMHVGGERFLVSDGQAVYELDAVRLDTREVAGRDVTGGNVSEVGFLDEGRFVVVTKAELQVYRRDGDGALRQWSLPRGELDMSFATSSRLLALRLTSEWGATYWASCDDDGMRWHSRWAQRVERLWCHDADGKHVGIAYSRVNAPDVFVLHNLPTARAQGDIVTKLARPAELPESLVTSLSK